MSPHLGSSGGNNHPVNLELPRPFSRLLLKIHHLYPLQILFSPPGNLPDILGLPPEHDFLLDLGALSRLGPVIGVVVVAIDGGVTIAADDDVVVLLVGPSAVLADGRGNGLSVRPVDALAGRVRAR